ncbi:MAG: 3-hydroxyacyl-CoA dehydrogenase NAD-binding domain-containing protein [Halofilum sp. (in: g-proteobacteria)]|nr:3-hydroxyacyl-CoA dehydrogenase NAD-binding domain-containing protein [Halofilum sp. (in: g-proteobacteria)]
MIDPTRTVRRAAVLGAGVMGAQIAAHFANAGVPVDLYELPAEEDDDPRAAARRAIDGLGRIRPAPLASRNAVHGIRAAGYDSDLERLAEADLVIEAVAERTDIKQQLYERIAPALREDTVLASNTSGLSIGHLAASLPAALRQRFCGVHFFNPPRYMHLVELVRHPGTDDNVIYRLEGFLTSGLGKGVLHARDTPGFIGNRVGVFALANVIHHAQRLELPFDLVDRLTGVGLGRPKSATLRTADVVGLDTFQHVLSHLHEDLEDDPWRAMFTTPEWLPTLVEQGALGQKSGAGIYRKGADGGIEVYEPARGDYRPVARQLDEQVRAALAEPDPRRKYDLLRRIDHPQAELIRVCHRDLFHYCCYHLQHIAPSAREVDFAMRWGFGWQRGPFELWQMIGWRDVAEYLDGALQAGETTADAPLPGWVREARRDGVHGPRGSWSAELSAWLPRSNHPVYRHQMAPPRLVGEPAPTSDTLWRNEAVRLWDAGDDVAVLSLHTPMHTIGHEALDGIEHAVKVAESKARALVLWQDEPPFSVGANLKQVRDALQAGDYDRVEAMVAQFQRVSGRLRHARLPVVGAAAGLALGGGLELLLHCDVRVLSLETYCGLVEAGVGVIPAGGGCAALARRAVELAPDGDPMPWLLRYFEEIAYARVTGSAAEAREGVWLRPGDRVILHHDELLYAAVSAAIGLADCAYRPPLRGTRYRVAGATGIATLQARLVNLHAGGFISDHDRAIGTALATALCGGPVDAGTEVDDAWIWRFERDGFMRLLRTPETAARIDHMLNTGKPLRN